jgi:hypothetical protein
LPSGACAAPDQVAYVAPSPGGTDNASCSLATPCTTIAKALATGRFYVKLAGTLNEQVTLNNRSVTLLAEPGARLTSTNLGTLLRVYGMSQVEIYDLELSGMPGMGGYGIEASPGSTATMVRVKLSGNQAGGLWATGSTVTVLQSTISDNAGSGIVANGGSLSVSQSTISSNLGGGITTVNDGAFEIVGNVFFKNGRDGAHFGAIAISTTQGGANRLEFNSFNSNKAVNGIGAAIQCGAGPFTARNNIMSENGTLTSPAQVGGTCMHAYSIVRPGPVPPGPGNSAMDPLFKNTTTGDLHLMPGSPAIRAADPSSVLAGIAERDIDGDKRTAPATIGADEVP